MSSSVLIVDDSRTSRRILKDILDGKSREKGLEKKIRKVLGYNG